MKDSIIVFVLGNKVLKDKNSNSNPSNILVPAKLYTVCTFGCK